MIQMSISGVEWSNTLLSIQMMDHWLTKKRSRSQHAATRVDFIKMVGDRSKTQENSGSIYLNSKLFQKSKSTMFTSGY